MAQTYAYKVRDKNGKTLSGSIDAESTALVANKLRQMGYVPIAIDKKKSSAGKKELTIGGFGGQKIKVWRPRAGPERRGGGAPTSGPARPGRRAGRGPARR